METKYYIYKTAKNDRWDSIATKFYGNCFDISKIIEANPHIAISPVIESGIEIRIPVKEQSTVLKEGIPLWRISMK